MTDAPNTPHQPKIEPAPSGMRFISAVWLVPIIAVMIALAIAWQSYANRGILVAIAFPDASGVEVGQTTLRFREVTVGVVEDVGFSADLSQVNVYVRVSRNIAPYLDEDASFWIVQPEVTARGVEGLNTILSGTYIEGTWDNDIGESRTAFRGDERAPIVPPGVNGTAIVLTARESSRMGPGSPILYRGIEVGEVADPRLSPDGSEIRIDAFILAPYDRQLSTATRFWDASGVSATLGAGGVELRVGSLAAILEGGVNFDTLISGGQPINRGHVFTIFEDEDAARASTFEQPSLRSLRFSVLFPNALTGLSEGAAVRYRGVRVGAVTSITGFVRPDDPDANVQLLAVMALQPRRMGVDDGLSDLEAVDAIGALVRDGMRAKLVSTSILGGDLAVDLVEPDDTAPAALEIGITDTPLIPTIASEDAGLVASAEGVFERLNGLPIEELLGSATDLMNNLNTIVASEDTRAIPGAALQTIEDGQALIRDGRNILSSNQTASVLADIE
ncbi:MAG: MlaD family protein, partial [Pseudomonadota bacterium]